MHIKKTIRDLITASAERARKSGQLAFETLPAFEVEAAKQAEHGDLATNLALVLAKQAKLPPRKVAEVIINHLAAPEGMLLKVEIAGPGFINFFIADAYWYRVISEIHRLGPAYGNSDLGAGVKVQVEFVSANPTGPLHIGHGRGAALGDALANLLAATGHTVEREYYINDVGNQILTLGKSLYFRLRELEGEAVEFPEDGYQGDYMKDLARDYLAQGGAAPAPEPHEDDLVRLGRYAGDVILADIKQDLEDFGVALRPLVQRNRALPPGPGGAELRPAERAGATSMSRTAPCGSRPPPSGTKRTGWCGAATGPPPTSPRMWPITCTNSSGAIDLVVDIWGADHHGYVPRLQAAAQALGFTGRLQVILVQLVSLLRQGEPVAMTTRGGTFVTLREVMDEVGKDAARFIFLTRRPDAQLEFDLEVAKQQSSENPVYYVQYAHARLASVFRQAAAQGIEMGEPDPARFPRLTLPEELAMLKMLANYPELVEGAARNLEPHRITYFLTELAAQLHSYYYKHRFISDDVELTQARLWLVSGVKTVLAHGLGILGVEAPETM